MDNSNRLVWTGQQRVHTSDTDYRSNAKLSFILDVMQRAADSAVDELGVSLDKLLEAGMAWMLITMDVQFNRNLRSNELLTIRTWSKGTKGALWQRDYRIFDGHNHEIANARSIWALVDTAKRKILRPTALPIEVEHYTKDSVGEPPEKASIPSEALLEKAYTYQVRYSGLDNNGHLNNAKYGDLCCDALSLEEWDGRRLKAFKITYAQEATYGQEIRVMRSPVGNEDVYVQGFSDDTVLFTACLTFS